MTDKPLVSIIIVNWNGELVLRECFESLRRLKYSNLELIFVDNGSVDSSLEIFRKYKSKFKIKTILVKNTNNLGFAPANNQGFEKSKGELILLLNNDTKVKNSFLDPLVKKMVEDQEIGIVQPKILVLDRPELLDNCGSFLTKTGFLEHWGFLKKNSKEYDKQRFVFSVKGACMLIKREVIEKVGLFDNDFVSYFEETDFCWKSWIAGWKVLYLPQSEIFHKIGFSSKKQNQILVNYHSLKNRIVSLLKNLEIHNLIMIGGLHLFLLTGLATYYLLTLQFNKSGMIWKSFFWNITNWRKTLMKRNAIQKIRVKSDREIFKYILKETNWKEMFIHFGNVEANFK